MRGYVQFNKYIHTPVTESCARCAPKFNLATCLMLLDKINSTKRVYSIKARRQWAHGQLYDNLESIKYCRIEGSGNIMLFGSLCTARRDGMLDVCNRK